MDSLRFLIQFLFAGIKFVISSLFGKKRLVTAAFDDLSFFQYHDGIRVSDRGESVRDHEGGTVLHQAIHAVLDMALGSGIDRRGRLVEDENRCLGYGGAGDVQKLTLSLRQVRSVALKDRIVSVLETHDKLCALAVFAASTTSSSVASGLP